MGAFFLPAAVQISRKPEQIQRIGDLVKGFTLVQQGIDLAKKRCKPAQVHLIVFHHARQRVR